MYILSKYKDYYDYLSGIYGVDPLLVLDRRVHDNYDCILPEMVCFHICNKVIQGWFDGKKFYYGEDLKQVGEYHPANRWCSSYVKVKDPYCSNTYRVIQTDIYLSNINTQQDCPILIKNSVGSYCKFPQLSKFDLGKVYPPEEIYKDLSAWLSNKRTQQESSTIISSDKEKIVSKGFDLKTSFRHPIK